MVSMRVKWMMTGKRDETACCNSVQTTWNSIRIWSRISGILRKKSSGNLGRDTLKASVRNLHGRAAKKHPRGQQSWRKLFWTSVLTA